MGSDKYGKGYGWCVFDRLRNYRPIAANDTYFTLRTNV